MPPSDRPVTKYWRTSPMTLPREGRARRDPAFSLVQFPSLLERVGCLLERHQQALVVGQHLVVAREDRVVPPPRLLEGRIVLRGDALVAHLEEGGAQLRAV